MTIRISPSHIILIHHLFVLKTVVSVSPSQEILNHVLIDVELFMGLLAATVLPQGENGKKKKAISKKKSKTKGFWPHGIVAFIFSAKKKL